MRKVLRCDHCSHNEEEHDAEKMALHEKKCSFDPDNRSCWTCKHRYDEYGSNYCEIGLPQINDWMKSDGELCKGWEEDYDEENETDEQRGVRLARKNRII